MTNATSITPIGRGVFLYLDNPDTGREYSDGKFKLDLYVSKEDYKKEGGDLTKNILQLGRILTGKDNISLKNFKHPLVDVDQLPDEQKENCQKKSEPATLESGLSLLIAQS